MMLKENKLKHGWATEIEIIDKDPGPGSFQYHIVLVCGHDGPYLSGPGRSLPDQHEPRNGSAVVVPPSPTIKTKTAPIRSQILSCR